MTHTPEDPFTPVPDGSQPQPQPQVPGTAPDQQNYAATPQYAQPQYPYPASGPRPGTEKNWMGITALVLSLASLVTGITAIGGIIFGHLSVAAAKRGEADNGGLGRAGLILGYVFLVIGILVVIGLIWFIGLAASECTGYGQPDWCA